MKKEVKPKQPKETKVKKVKEIKPKDTKVSTREIKDLARLNSTDKKMKMAELREKTQEIQIVRKLESTDTRNISLKDELKTIKKANRKPKGIKSIPNSEGNLIDVVNMSKSYVSGKVRYDALKEVSFSIKAGEFIVILGPSGSGKSTLLNVLSGLDRPTMGEVIIGGINLSALNNSELTTFRRNNIGFVFQSYNLLPELNAYDNVEIGRILQMDNNKRLDVMDLMGRVNLKGKEKNAVTELSGGQLQRISIARALAKNPKIIFADEPTGALDTDTSEKVLELFKEINKKYNTTIIFVTHNREIADLADRVLEVKDGVATFRK